MLMGRYKAGGKKGKEQIRRQKLKAAVLGAVNATNWFKKRTDTFRVVHTSKSSCMVHLVGAPSPGTWVNIPMSASMVHQPKPATQDPSIASHTSGLMVSNANMQPSAAQSSAGVSGQSSAVQQGQRVAAPAATAANCQQKGGLPLLDRLGGAPNSTIALSPAPLFTSAGAVTPAAALAAAAAERVTAATERMTAATAAERTQTTRRRSGVVVPWTDWMDSTDSDDDSDNAGGSTNQRVTKRRMKKPRADKSRQHLRPTCKQRTFIALARTDGKIVDASALEKAELALASNKHVCLDCMCWVCDRPARACTSWVFLAKGRHIDLAWAVHVSCVSRPCVMIVLLSSAQVSPQLSHCMADANLEFWRAKRQVRPPGPQISILASVFCMSWCADYEFWEMRRL